MPRNMYTDAGRPGHALGRTDYSPEEQARLVMTLPMMPASRVVHFFPGRTANGIRGAARRLGIRRYRGRDVYRWWTWREKRQLETLALAGQSAREIASQLGRSIDSVKHQARARGISLKQRGERSASAKYSDTLCERIRTMHDEGVGPKAIFTQLQAEGVDITWWGFHSIVYYKRTAI